VLVTIVPGVAGVAAGAALPAETVCEGVVVDFDTQADKIRLTSKSAINARFIVHFLLHTERGSERSAVSLMRSLCGAADSAALPCPLRYLACARARSRTNCVLSLHMCVISHFLNLPHSSQRTKLAMVEKESPGDFVRHFPAISI